MGCQRKYSTDSGTQFNNKSDEQKQWNKPVLRLDSPHISILKLTQSNGSQLPHGIDGRRRYPSLHREKAAAATQNPSDATFKRAGFCRLILYGPTAGDRVPSLAVQAPPTSDRACPWTTPLQRTPRVSILSPPHDLPYLYVLHDIPTPFFLHITVLPYFYALREKATTSLVRHLVCTNHAYASLSLLLAL
ncbi:Hypothetical protein CINCED_3A012322 [Cinara cedri]|uniref:Uncharacterized protein n=1 Tax=Cinara cedri TaxID=506608 RepID=A0A5E4MPE9_9HEMI|nr:Hypothetical protein CINCED_3A012322 [Cinara cedri]